MRISVETYFRDCYEILWEKAPKDEIIERGYDVIDHLFTNNLLFVGINPGYIVVESDNKTSSKGSRISTLPFDYKYYKPFMGVSIECGFRGDYSYLDILAIRETSLATIKSKLKDKDFLKFCQDQFVIFKKMVCMAKPQVIVVCNAYAGTWMGKPDNTFIKQKLNPHAFLFNFDDTIGTYRIKDASCLDTVPVYFTGMFSGRHNIDKGSLERLEWQIRHAKYNHTLNIK